MQACSGGVHRTNPFVAPNHHLTMHTPQQAYCTVNHVLLHFAVLEQLSFSLVGAGLTVFEIVETKKESFLFLSVYCIYPLHTSPLPEKDRNKKKKKKNSSSFFLYSIMFFMSMSTGFVLSQALYCNMIQLVVQNAKFYFLYERVFFFKSCTLSQV